MTQKKTRTLKAKRKSKNLFLNKKAFSVVLSTLIITAGVLAAGIAVLYWAYSWGNIADQQYSSSATASQNAMSEMIGFEYITYSNSPPCNLTIYIINCGLTNGLNISRIYVWNNQSQFVGTFPVASQTTIILMNTTTNMPIPNNQLNKGNDAYFNVTIPQGTLISSSYYTIQVVTQRGRNFDGAFYTP